MDEINREGKSVGIILDCTLDHESNGRRLIDNVKKILIEFVKILENGLDNFYLFHPDLYDLTNNRGEQVCSIGNYQTSGKIFNVEYALKQTLSVLCLEEYCEKYLILITNRNSCNMEKIQKIAERDNVEVKIFKIIIGNDIKNSSELLEFLKGKVNGANTHSQTD